MAKKSDDAKLFELNSLGLEDLIRKIAPLLKGKDGRDGKDGKDGRDGRDGLRVKKTIFLFLLNEVRGIVNRNLKIQRRGSYENV